MSNFVQGGIALGATSVSLAIPILSYPSGVPTAVTGITGATIGDPISGLTVGVWRPGGSVAAFTPSKLSGIGASWTSGGWAEVSSTDHPGLYRLDVPNTHFASASGADEFVFLTVKYTGGSAVPYRVCYPFVPAGGAPSDSSGVTTLLDRLTATRAGYLDNINDTDMAALDSGLDAANTAIGNANAVLAKLDTALMLDGSVWQFTANALELAPALTAAAVWAAVQEGNTTAGTMGALALAASTAGDPWSTLNLKSYPEGSAGRILATRLSTARFMLGPQR